MRLNMKCATRLCVATLSGIVAYGFAVSSSYSSDRLHLAASSDGAGLPGLPGGKGGKSGEELARERGKGGNRAGDESVRLKNFCIDLLRGRKSNADQNNMRPSDCSNYFVDLDKEWINSRSAQNAKGGDGPDGRSIDGGVGGKGGKGGAGSGGGRGGAGGDGVGGGVGGRGGSGGDSD